MKCLVTGATGFIGRELCSQLASREVPFTALSRCGGPLADGSSSTAVDFETEEVDAQLLSGIDTVFHLAGIAHQQALQSSYFRVNYHSTLAIAEAAEAAGVKCFVYLSSVKAMGPARGVSPRAEDEITTPGNAYGLSKLKAEQDLQARFSGSGMSIIVLRPALVYGSEAKGNLLSLRRAIRLGMPRPPEAGGRSMIGLPDLVELMLQLASHPPVGFYTWIVSDGQAYSARKLYELMRSADGKGKGVSWLPLWAWRFAANLVDRLRGTSGDSTFSKMFGTELYSNSLLLKAIPWQPKLRFSDLAGSIMAMPDKAAK